MEAVRYEEPRALESSVDKNAGRCSGNFRYTAVDYCDDARHN